MSIAFIEGDVEYGSTVHFFIGGTKEERIRAVANLFSNSRDQLENADFPENTVNWESEEEIKKYVTELFLKDLKCLNDEDFAKHEIYFYISAVDTENEWYKHFEFITSKKGLSITWHHL
jgi:hypothetical protein